MQFLIAGILLLWFQLYFHFHKAFLGGRKLSPQNKSIGFIFITAYAEPLIYSFIPDPCSEERTGMAHSVIPLEQESLNSKRWTRNNSCFLWRQRKDRHASWMTSFHSVCCLHSKKKSRNLHHTHVCNESKGQHRHLMWFQNCRSSPPRSILLDKQYFLLHGIKPDTNRGLLSWYKGEMGYHMVHYLGLIKIHPPRVLTHFQIIFPTHLPMYRRGKGYHSIE